VLSMADDDEKVVHPSTELSDDELESRLTEFDEKVKKAAASRMPDVPEWNYQRPAKPPAAPASASSGIAFGFSLLYTLLGPIIGGYLIGLLIDKTRHTQGASTIGVLIGMAGGFVAMVLVAMHRMKVDDKR